MGGGGRISGLRPDGCKSIYKFISKEKGGKVEVVNSSRSASTLVDVQTTVAQQPVVPKRKVTHQGQAHEAKLCLLLRLIALNIKDKTRPDQQYKTIIA